MLAAVLALLASFSWGTADFLAGVESRRSTAWTAALGGQLVASLSLIAILLVAAPARPSLGALAAPLFGGAVGGAGVLLQYRALALVDMSVVSPIVAGAALVPVLWGTAIGERPSPLQTAGIALTIVGIALISRRAPDAEAGARRLDRVGVLMSVAAAAAFGLFLVALRYGGKSDPLWTVTIARTAAMLTLAAVAGVTRPAIRLRRSAILVLVVVGLLIVAANLLFTSATTLGYLSIVGVLGWLNPAVTMAWARLWLHERLRPLQIAAAALVFAGIVCLTLR
ncbi:MAG TPA: DMT family transporter [Thermoleophilia bacterium]|nr:DMT family transporter [Thermoleophilia bacterium]